MLQCKENVHTNLPKKTNAHIGEQLGSDCTLNSHKFVQVIEQNVDTFLMSVILRGRDGGGVNNSYKKKRV